MAKKTTYQRLKEERLELLNDIRLIVMEPDCQKAKYTKMMYRLRFNTEDMFWFGSSSLKNKDNG